MRHLLAFGIAFDACEIVASSYSFSICLFKLSHHVGKIGGGGMEGRHEVGVLYGGSGFQDACPFCSKFGLFVWAQCFLMALL